ncbi:MAG: tyrosine recombinase XerC [Holosporales bacterium]|jgi:integrase/recombinase XerC|nr:tyrosine recombinase XerC [Holosporales bacterium]
MGRFPVVWILLVFVLLSTWVSDLKISRGLSDHTVASYLSDIKLLLKFLQFYREETITIEDVAVIDHRDVRSWILWRRNKGDTPKSIVRGLAALKCFLKWCICDGVIKQSDVLKFKNPKIQKSLPRPVAIEDINDLMTSVEDVKKTDWIVKRDEALFVLIYSVGLRISEAINLKRSDFTNSSGFLPIYGKGGKARSVPLIDRVSNIINTYLVSSIFNSSEYLFVNRFGDRLSASAVQKLLKIIRRRLGLSETVTPHALRHSCATHLMESSGDIRSIQELLGHSSISSTQIYTHVAQKYISDIYDKCHPLSNKLQKKVE